MRRPTRKPLALLAVVTLSSAALDASALTPDDTKCRSAIQKTTAKLGATALKEINRCLKAEMKAPTGTNCNDLANAVITVRGKVAKTRAKLLATVGGASTHCRLPDHAASLAEFGSICPSPANDTSISGFADVGVCEADIAEGMVENVRRYLLNPDTAAIAAYPHAGSLARCASAIARSSTKLWSAVTKTRGECQNAEDAAAPADGDVDGCATFDDGKIAAAATKLRDAIQSSCGGLTAEELFQLHACAADVPTLQTCAAHAIQKNAGGINSSSYEFTGVCPTAVKLKLNSGTPTTLVGGNLGHQSKTTLDIGWTGIGHSVDVMDGFVTRLNLNCSEGSCSSCAISASCEEGNCRCSQSTAIECGHTTGPFTEDVCGTGNVCYPMFGPPLPLNAGGNPACVTNVINVDLAGSADVGTGSSSTHVSDIAKVYLGNSQSQPCPTCSGAGIGDSGTCSGGLNDGSPCVTNAIHPDFGNVSYQCHPSLATNISAAGLKLMLDFTDGSTSLPFGDACDSPLGASSCACGACSLDSTAPCNGDADCAGAGLGTCTKGSGMPRYPNNCSSLVCEDQGGGLGECDQSTPDRYAFCDGLRRKSGDGIIGCLTNDDCVALASECPGGNCGDCTLEQPKRCFLDPIEATGLPGFDGSEVVSTFCATAANNAGINGAIGLPGPGRITLDWDFTAYCPDGTTEYELGGANCP